MRRFTPAAYDPKDLSIFVSFPGGTTPPHGSDCGSSRMLDIYQLNKTNKRRGPRSGSCHAQATLERLSVCAAGAWTKESLLVTPRPELDIFGTCGRRGQIGWPLDNHTYHTVNPAGPERVALDIRLEFTSSRTNGVFLSLPRPAYRCSLDLATVPSLPQRGI